MGCTSSTQAAVRSSGENTASQSHEASSGAVSTQKRGREKKITAATEAMLSISSHNDDGGGNTDDGKLQPPAENIPSEGHAQAETQSSAATDFPANMAGSLIAGNFTLRYACLSRQGRDPDHKLKPNQDCYSVHHKGAFSPNATGAFFGVYDGHGPSPHGEACSQFVQQRLPDMVKNNLEKERKHSSAIGKENLSVDQVQLSLQKAHTECNDELHKSPINDSYSGTTSISLYIHSDHVGDESDNTGAARITVCNVGDSRAVLGTNARSSSNSKWQAVPLSKDQTPHRADEAERCIRSGARILSFGQIDPNTNQDDEDSEIEDPPRVWSREGKYPGTAFSRSMGDAVAESLGVFAEPEMLTLKLALSEKLIVLASDGIFDVMSNQQVVDLCLQHRADPTQACNAVVEKSHEEWLLNEDCIGHEEAASYDDMTIICIFMDHKDDVTAYNDESTTDVQPSTAQHQHEHTHRKRVRQKTLRNLEEMAEEI